MVLYPCRRDLFRSAAIAVEDDKRTDSFRLLRVRFTTRLGQSSAWIQEEQNKQTQKLLTMATKVLSLLELIAKRGAIIRVS